MKKMVEIFLSVFKKGKGNKGNKIQKILMYIIFSLAISSMLLVYYFTKDILYPGIIALATFAVEILLYFLPFSKEKEGKKLQREHHELFYRNLIAELDMGNTFFDSIILARDSLPICTLKTKLNEYFDTNSSQKLLLPLELLNTFEEQDLINYVNSGMDRRNIDLKYIRNLKKLYEETFESSGDNSELYFEGIFSSLVLSIALIFVFI